MFLVCPIIEDAYRIQTIKLRSLVVDRYKIGVFAKHVRRRRLFFTVIA